MTAETSDAIEAIEATEPREAADETDTTADGDPEPPDTEASDDAGAAEPSELSRSETFELLKNYRRRHVLHYLDTHGGEATVSDLAEYLAVEENDLEAGAYSSDQRKRAYVGLYQCHLPKMDSKGVVEFEKNRGDVRLREPASQLLPYLEIDDPADETTSGVDGERDGDETEESEGPSDPDTWTGLDRFRPFVAGGVGASVLGGLAEVPGLAQLSPSAWAVVAVVSMVVLEFGDAVGHLRV